MDMKLYIWTLMAAVGLTRVDAQLRCIECTHISWKQKYDFKGAANIYRILQSKYNPACAQKNPFDRDEYNRNLQTQQQQNTGQFFNANYDIGKTICYDNSAQDKCHYLHGNVTIVLPSYEGRMVLNMHVRNCDKAPERTAPEQCYDRRNQLGNQDAKYFIHSRLTFLSQDVQVESFYGEQCYCNSNLCTPDVSAARNLVASCLSILLSLVVFIALS